MAAGGTAKTLGDYCSCRSRCYETYLSGRVLIVEIHTSCTQLVGQSEHCASNPRIACTRVAKVEYEVCVNNPRIV